MLAVIKSDYPNSRYEIWKGLFMRDAIPFVVFALITWANVAIGQERFSEGSRDRKTLFSWPEQPSDTSDENESAETEEEPIATDRPDFTESSTTVGRGTSQLEMGYSYFQNRDGGLTTRSHSWGEPLRRLGIGAEWFELRVAVSPTSIVENAGGVRTRQTGVEDLYLGCKLGLTEQSGWLPEIALVPQMTVPTGSTPFTNDQVLPGTNLLFGWDINDKYSCAGSTQFNQSIDGLGDTYTEWAPQDE